MRASVEFLTSRRLRLFNPMHVVTARISFNRTSVSLALLVLLVNAWGGKVVWLELPLGQVLAAFCVRTVPYLPSQIKIKLRFQRS